MIDYLNFATRLRPEASDVSFGKCPSRMRNSSMKFIHEESEVMAASETCTTITQSGTSYRPATLAQQVRHELAKTYLRDLRARVSPRAVAQASRCN